MGYQICDGNRNGTLDPEEFEKCCRLNNLGLSSSDMAVLHAHFDRDRSGGVGYEEFLRAVRGRLQPARKQVVKKIFDVLDKCARATNRTLLAGRAIRLPGLALLRARMCARDNKVSDPKRVP